MTKMAVYKQKEEEIQARDNIILTLLVLVVILFAGLLYIGITDFAMEIQSSGDIEQARELLNK